MEVEEKVEPVEEEEGEVGERRKLPRRQILSTESESECALSGECAGLDGGASNSINRRKNRPGVTAAAPSGDSADGELSEDDSQARSGDKTSTSPNKKLHKKSPKKSFNSSFSRARKAKREGEMLTKKSLRIHDTSDEENSEGEDSDSEALLSSRSLKGKLNSSMKVLDTSSSESEEDKDLNLRKREEKPRREEKLRKEEKPRKEDKSRLEEKLKKDDKIMKEDKVRKEAKSHDSTEVAKAPESKEKQRRLSGSEHSDSAMPELEPQVTTGSPMQSTPKKPSSNSSKDPLGQSQNKQAPPKKEEVKRSKSKDDRKNEQKSIKEFFLQKAQETSASSMDENGKTAVKEVKKEKDKAIAIENNFGANKEYLTAFESFVKKEKSPRSKVPPSPPKEKTNKDAVDKSKEMKKSFVLLASTLHPKKVVREEMKNEKRKAEEKKKKEEEDIKRKVEERKKKEEEEKRGTKRKEREWEEEKQREKEEQQRKEKSESERKDKEEKRVREAEEKERIEKEEEQKKKDQVNQGKKNQKTDVKEKLEFESKVPLPVSSPKKVGKSQEIEMKSDTPQTNQPPETNPKVSPEKDCLGDQIDVKTPKKLRRWPPENESPDPKKNFIKKHQEEQEKLHLESIANSPKPVPAATTAASPNPPKDPATVVAPTIVKPEKLAEDVPRQVENSPFENLGYNSGDDVSRYSDDHLNKQLIVKPNTVLTKDGSEDGENATKVESTLKTIPEEVEKTIEDKNGVHEAVKVEKTIEDKNGVHEA